jgi:D-alanyl-lipoteichoic acid acyltransferase DltB (MBOAT superfamily)
MTLSSWLRDYIYIILGGSWHGRIRQVFNIFVVMVISGIWHGAGLRFLLWGALNALVMCIETGFGWNKMRSSNIWIHFARSTFTYLVVAALGLLFVMPFKQAVSHAATMVTKSWMISPNQVPEIAFAFPILLFSLPVFLIHTYVIIKEHTHNAAFRTPLVRLRLNEAILSVMLFLVLTNPGNPESFVYFQF